MLTVIALILLGRCCAGNEVRTPVEFNWLGNLVAGMMTEWQLLVLGLFLVAKLQGSAVVRECVQRRLARLRLNLGESAVRLGLHA